MPTLLTNEDIRGAIENQSFIKNGRKGAIDGVKYDFHLGNKILKSEYNRPVNIDRLSEAEKSSLVVDPGEVVFVLTEERIELPNDVMAVLTPKRKLAHTGIMILGGLSVDPLYEGKLWIGLYNFSSTPFPIIPGRKLIAAMFYKLSEEEAANIDKPHSQGGDEFPDELVDLIKKYKPIEVRSIQNDLNKTIERLSVLEDKINKDSEWMDKFKSGLEAHNAQIDRILQTIEKEQQARESGDEKLSGQIDGLRNMFANIRPILIVGGIVITASITAIITIVLQNWLGTPSP